MTDAWLKDEAVNLGQKIDTGEIDPTVLTECFLEAMGAHPQGEEIFARFMPERARAEAKAATQRAKLGIRHHILDGVPVSWKDLFDTNGVETEAGSALLRGRVPQKDALVVTRATYAGLVCLGKTHMTELAFSGLGLNPITATPPNSNNATWVPGGSSSGAAASVAFGLSAIGMGSDTGGSVRIPAAWNDLVGLKTTHELVPCQGVLPLCAKFDTVGPICRSVGDAAAALSVLTNQPIADLGNVTLSGARLLILDTTPLGETRNPIEQAFADTISILKKTGAVVEKRKISAVNEVVKLSSILFAPEAYATWRDKIEAAPEKMFGEILERFRGGKNILAVDYCDAWRVLLRCRQEYLAQIAGYDAVLLPTAPIMPPNKKRLLADSDYYQSENLLALRNTRIANLLGLCGLSLPTQAPAIGLMLLGTPFCEAKILRLGRAVEQVLGRR